MMVSVSQLISDIEGVTGTRFKESLGVINNYAKKDRLLTVWEKSYNVHVHCSKADIVV